jgi:hypothetical protein
MSATETPAAKQLAAPRGRPPRHPSGRNLQLYHELVCEGRPQTEVAARFRVSQARVAQIKAQIALWVSRLLPATVLPQPDDAGRRFHLAIASCRLRLQSAYEEFLACFGGTSGAAGYGHLLAASDAGVLSKELATRLPPRDLVQSAVRMADELEGLARVARRGPYYKLPDDQR